MVFANLPGPAGCPWGRDQGFLLDAGAAVLAVKSALWVLVFPSGSLTAEFRLRRSLGGVGQAFGPVIRAARGSRNRKWSRELGTQHAEGVGVEVVGYQG